MYLPPFFSFFLFTASKSGPFEYLRLTSLGVVGALAKNDSSDVINFLLTTKITLMHAHHRDRARNQQNRGRIHCSEDPPG